MSKKGETPKQARRRDRIERIVTGGNEQDRQKMEKAAEEILREEKRR